MTFSRPLVGVGVSQAWGVETWTVSQTESAETRLKTWTSQEIQESANLMGVTMTMPEGHAILDCCCVGAKTQSWSRGKKTKRWPHKNTVLTFTEDRREWSKELNRYGKEIFDDAEEKDEVHEESDGLQEERCRSDERRRSRLSGIGGASPERYVERKICCTVMGGGPKMGVDEAAKRQQSNLLPRCYFCRLSGQTKRV